MQANGSAAIVTREPRAGAAAAWALADAGYGVFGLDVRSGDDTAGDVEYLSADVTDEEQVQRAVDHVTATDAPLRDLPRRNRSVHPGPRTERPPRHGALPQGRRDRSGRHVRRVVDSSRGHPAHRPDGRRPARRHRQHRVDRSVRRTNRPGRPRIVPGGIAGLTLAVARDWGQSESASAPSPRASSTHHARHRERGVPSRARGGAPFPRRLARPDESAELVAILVSHDYLDGEVVRMDGALRMAPPLSGRRTTCGT
jgi:hypothetical protein